MVSADICASFRVSMENRSIFGNAPVFVHNETPPMIRHDSQSKSDMEKGRDQNRDASETASLLSFRACLNYTIGAYIRQPSGKRRQAARRVTPLPLAEAGRRSARTFDIGDHGDVLRQERQHPVGRNYGWVRAVKESDPPHGYHSVRGIIFTLSNSLGG